MAMKRNLDLIGKGLAGAGLTGIVLYIVGTATQHKWPYWPYLVFILMLIVGGMTYFAGQRADAVRAAEADTDQDLQEGQPAPAFTDRWLHSSNGHEAPGLMMITHKGFSHPGYMIPPSQNKPPFVRIGVLVTCDPLAHAPTTSDLRDRFLAFLGRSPVSELANALTYVGDDLSWRSYASNGRINNEAVLVASDDQPEAPVVSAMMNLHETGLPSYGSNPRVAELLLHIEPRDEDGQVAPATALESWYGTIIRVMGIAKAFAEFLSDDIGIATYDQPSTKVGIQLSAHRSLTEIVDACDLRSVAGSQPSNWFLGYLIAEPDGSEPAEAGVELLTRLCDHGLHLHGYEAVLDKLRSK
jgi:hypothetical protein